MTGKTSSIFPKPSETAYTRNVCLFIYLLFFFACNECKLLAIVRVYRTQKRFFDEGNVCTLLKQLKFLNFG